MSPGSSVWPALTTLPCTVEQGQGRTESPTNAATGDQGRAKADGNVDELSDSQQD